MVNGRITVEQMEWLANRAEELGGNLSAALRQTITDARLLEVAREDFTAFRKEHPEFDVPPHADDGTSWAWDVYLTLRPTDVEDAEMRREEADSE
jgi:hypothetical protein